MQNLITLTGYKSSLIIDCSGDAPQIIYWGTKLSVKSTDQMIKLLQLRQEAPASPAKEVPLSLTPTIGQGYLGHPGLKIQGETDQWATALCISEVIESSTNQFKIINTDVNRHIQVTYQISMDATTDVVTISTQMTNLSAVTIKLDWCAAATLPTPSYATNLIGFEGHWAGEFQTHRLEQHYGSYVRENRRGRTSHDSFPGLLICSPHTNQQTGDVYGFHLGFSGNHKIVAEKLADGRTCVQMGELLLPGEITLGKDESYTSPTLYASFGCEGLSSLSQQFHRHVRQHLIRPAVQSKPRPVHYNTWEGVYFEHDIETLKDLANRAAALGAERFVLDDGWFDGRNDDTTGLGDWFVDKNKYPQGLGPLIEHIASLGLEFGLWFEPEMVNPSSNLYRAHPDWVLGTAPNPQLGFRNQLALDLTRNEVFDYLFERIDSLLSEYTIDYIKWDMNRDLNHPGNHLGQPAGHLQTKAFYRLVAAVKAAHPYVEIESCASGGGRADYGVLTHTDRIWTSDSNDALERLKIQKGFSYFFPTELMGSHIGPRHCHTTHRTLSMAMRASAVLFGHMGLEMDLRELTESEQIELKAMVNLYKQHRQLIHSGDLYRLELPEYMNGLGVVSTNKQHALFACSLITCSPSSLPTPFYFTGLNKEAIYRLDVIWPIKMHGHWPKESIFNFETNLPTIDGQHFSGELLMKLGLQLPLLTPQSALIFELVAVS